MAGIEGRRLKKVGGIEVHPSLRLQGKPKFFLDLSAESRAQTFSESQASARKLKHGYPLVSFSGQNHTFTVGKNQCINTKKEAACGHWTQRKISASLASKAGPRKSVATITPFGSSKKDFGIPVTL